MTFEGSVAVSAPPNNGLDEDRDMIPSPSCEVSLRG